MGDKMKDTIKEGEGRHWETRRRQREEAKEIKDRVKKLREGEDGLVTEK